MVDKNQIEDRGVPDLPQLVHMSRDVVGRGAAGSPEDRPYEKARSRLLTVHEG